MTRLEMNGRNIAVTVGIVLIVMILVTLLAKERNAPKPPATSANATPSTPAQARPETADFSQELAKLKRENPAEYEKRRAQFTLMTKTLLGRLGYDVGPLLGAFDAKAEVSLRRYQRDRRMPVTGDPLSFETVEQVQADLATLDNHPIGLPRKNVFIDFWDGGFVSAAGTWTIAGEAHAFPEQTSRIECRRQMGACTESTASVRDGILGGLRLVLDVDIYEIERWDQVEITTKPRAYECVRYVLRFNRVQGSVTGTRYTTAASDGPCKGVDKSEKHLRLEDGLDLFLKRRNEHEAKQKEIIVPELWKALGGT